MKRVLDLHNIKCNTPMEIEDVVARKVDNFVTPFLQHKNNSDIKIEIVVGRGMSSNNWIEGKNPMRYYTERYLSRLGIQWQNSYDNGAIIIWL